MNYYELLNVQESASVSEIKKSYKSLVKQYHPDVYDGDKAFAEKKIKELNQAYEILSDPSSKSEYDRVLNTVRKETSKIYSAPNYEDIAYEKSELEKKYNEMYNYDYYKKYTTNYYGVDKSHEKNKSSNAITPDNIVQKSKIIISRFVNTSQTKILILILALLLIIGLIAAISLLSKVNELLSSPVSPENSFYGTDTTVPYNNTYTPVYSGEYDAYGQDLNELYSEYTNYISNYLNDDFSGIVTKGTSVYQITAFYGEPERYEENNGFVYAYYQTSYIVYDQYGFVVDVINNGYFLTENELTTIQNQTKTP